MPAKKKTKPAIVNFGYLIYFIVNIIWNLVHDFKYSQNQPFNSFNQYLNILNEWLNRIPVLWSEFVIQISNSITARHFNVTVLSYSNWCIRFSNGWIWIWKLFLFVFLTFSILFGQPLPSLLPVCIVSLLLRCQLEYLHGFTLGGLLWTNSILYLRSLKSSLQRVEWGTPFKQKLVLVDPALPS